MTRTVFTFGTLCEEQIISALLGYTPEPIFATLTGYSVYLGTQAIMPKEIKQDFISKGRDLSNFKFLFAKKDENIETKIESKAYHITTADELFLDWWERYPKWYRKQDVHIQNNQGESMRAFIYTIDKNGEKLQNFVRNPNNNTEEAVENAQKLRERVKMEFPC